MRSVAIAITSTGSAKAQRLHAFALVSDADKTFGQVGDDLLARQRRAAALDHAALAVDLVGTVHVQRQRLHLGSLQHADAVPAQPLAAALRARHRAGDAVAPRGQRVDEMIDRRPGAHTHDGAIGHLIECRPADQRFQFVLCHDGGLSGVTRLRQSCPMSFDPQALGYALTRPFLFGLDAEQAHDLTLDAISRLQHSPARRLWSRRRVDDPVTLAGLRFPNRVGLAAGLDKNGRCIDGLGAMGFGFIEVGTVTPKPQPGNAKPRVFRLPQAQALINRLGFNNQGLDSFVANVQRAHRHRAAGGIVGLNIGKNASTPIERAVDDFRLGLDGVAPHADYVTVNISSPNTQNLRALQSDEALDALLAALVARRDDWVQRLGRAVPMFVKIAPDLDDAQIGVIAATLRRHRLDGVIATNTTIARDAVKGLPHAQEMGGLSGAPVFEASNRVIRALRSALGEGFPIIGVGGVMSGADARAKIDAGADLVQIYTGLIYKGPALVTEVARALAQGR
jgi:dihydroorotate dehydrogenase